MEPCTLYPGQFLSKCVLQNVNTFGKNWIYNHRKQICVKHGVLTFVCAPCIVIPFYKHTKQQTLSKRPLEYVVQTYSLCDYFVTLAESVTTQLIKPHIHAENITVMMGDFADVKCEWASHMFPRQSNQLGTNWVPAWFNAMFMYNDPCACVVRWKRDALRSVKL